MDKQTKTISEAAKTGERLGIVGRTIVKNKTVAIATAITVGTLAIASFTYFFIKMFIVGNKKGKYID